MPSFLHLFVCTLFFLSTTNTIEISICNCSTPTYQGTIDLRDPLYCSDLGMPVIKHWPVSYELITIRKDPISFKGYACSQWLSIKEISTNFLLSHDTIFKKEVLKVSSEECWKTINYPHMCDNAPMIKDNSPILQHILNPEGEGVWMQTKIYRAKNCVTQEINLMKECHNCPVTSPYGIIATSSDDKFATHNEITIVWPKPDATQEPLCDYKSIHRGKGEIIKTEFTSKLQDRISQRYCAQITLFFLLWVSQKHTLTLEINPFKKFNIKI